MTFIVMTFTNDQYIFHELRIFEVHDDKWATISLVQCDGKKSSINNTYHDDIPIITHWGWFSRDVLPVTCCEHAPPPPPLA